MNKRIPRRTFEEFQVTQFKKFSWTFKNRRARWRRWCETNRELSKYQNKTGGVIFTLPELWANIMRTCGHFPEFLRANEHIFQNPLEMGFKEKVKNGHFRNWAKINFSQNCWKIKNLNLKLLRKYLFQYSGPVITRLITCWGSDHMTLWENYKKFHLRSSSSYTMVLFSGVWRLISSSRTHFLKLCHFGISHQVPSVPQTFRKKSADSITWLFT